MPRKSRHYSNATPLLALSLLMGLMSVPKANSHFLDLLGPTVSAAIAFPVNSTGDDGADSKFASTLSIATLTTTVNTLGDAADTNVGDGHCDTDGNLGDGDQCTLRAAIQETASSADTIGFSLLPNSTITLTSALDAINGDLVITGPNSGLTVSGNLAVCPLNPVVTSNADSGAGTLRQAIMDACAGDTITFDMTPGHVTSPITLTSGGLTISKNLTIQGPGANILTVMRSTAGGTPHFRIFTINSGTVAISGFTISNGFTADGTNDVNSPTAGDNGGGILNSGTLTLTGVTMSGNQTGNGGSASAPGHGGGAGGFGGGIDNEGTLTLTNSTVSGNRTNNGGSGGPGGFSGFLGGQGGDGGGIFNSGTLTITNTTVDGNQTGIGGFGGGGGSGGGISNRGTTTLTNSSITGNTTRLLGNGGGIHNGSNSTVTLTNSTVSGNTADSLGGGIINAGDINGTGTANVKNTIVANNRSRIANGPEDLTGTFNSQDYNLFGNASGAIFTGTTTHNMVNTSANLGALANNGGPTQTMLPLPGSPAINAGDPANLPPDTFDLNNNGDTTEPLPIDQRGFPRVVGTNFDIGAVETNYAINATAGTPQSAPPNTAFGTQLQATVTESGNPISGATVTFTAPGSGPSGTFPGNVTTADVATNGSGVATAPVFTANGSVGGPYNVVANFGTGLPTASFALTTVNASADLAVTKSGPATITAGTNITYNVNVTNNGPNDAQSVTLSDTLPAGTTFFSETQNTGPAFTCNNPSVGGTGSVSCTIGTLASGASATFTLVFKVNNNVADGTTISNTASAASSTSDPIPGNNSQATITTVNDVNDPPDAVDDALSSVAEDSGVRTIPIASLLANDTKGPANESGQTLSFSLVGGSEVGGTVSSDGTNVYFTPTADFNGPVSFQYTVTDNGTTNGAPDPKSDTATASFTVWEVNDAPTAVNDELADVAEDSGDRTIPFAVLTANDSKGPANESGQTLIIKTVNNVVGGTVSIVGGNVIFTPTADYYGGASFQYTVEDNGTIHGAADPKTSAPAVVRFTITEVNDAPTAVNDTLSNVAEDSGARTIPFSTLTANDSKGPANESSQTLIVKTVSNAVGGTVSIVGGNVLFTPTADFNGAASFQYTVEDNGTTNGVADPKTSAPATVSFNITAVAETPSVTNAVTTANTQTTSGLVISRNPADGVEVTHFKITGITGGTLFKNNGTTVINNGDFITFAEGNAGLKFTPGTTNGSFTVQASLSPSDAGLGGGTATATITVNAVGGVIRFSAANYSVAEGAGFKTITVERTGDTSQAVTVDYASSDHSNPADFIPCTAAGVGFASSRCDFTTAIGTLRFAAGEASKTFNVLIGQDNYVDGSKTLNLTLSKIQAEDGVVFGVPSSATLTITDDATEGATNSVDIFERLRALPVS